MDAVVIADHHDHGSLRERLGQHLELVLDELLESLIEATPQNGTTTYNRAQLLAARAG